MDMIETFLAGLDRAAELRRRLLDRQGDLLELENNVRAVRSGWGDGAVFIDEAEDARGTIRDHEWDQLTGIRAALSRTDDVMASAATDGVLDRDRAHVLAHVVNVSRKSDRHRVQDANVAPSPQARVLPGDPDRFDKLSWVDGILNRVRRRQSSGLKLLVLLGFLTGAVWGSARARRPAERRRRTGRLRSLRPSRACR